MKICNRFFNKSIFNGVKIITYDTESYRYAIEGNKDYIEYQDLCNYSIYDGHNYYNGTTKGQFLSDVYYLYKKYSRIMLIAHNSSYDIINLDLFKMFISKKPLFDLEMNGEPLVGSVNYVEYASKTHKIIFNDSFNYFKTSLDEIAKELGYEKYASKDDYGLEPKLWNAYIKKNGKELCNKDVFILYKLIIEMIRNDKICWGISMAQSTFKTFTKYYLNTTIDLKDFNDVALKSYHGGRNELYNLNYQPYVLGLDINSLYPYVYSKNKYSTSFRAEYHKYPIDELLLNIKNQSYNYLINLDYKIHDKNVRRVPIMEYHKNKLMEFLAYKDAWITGREFLALYTEYKDIDIKIHKIYEFNNEYLLKDYVNDFYQFKENSTGFKRNFYKGLLNSLYGKFGQHKSHSHFILIDDIKDDDLKQYVMMPDVSTHRYNGVFYTTYGDYVAYNTQGESIYAVLIASEITADARLYNYYIQKTLGFDNVVYTDTDSFFVINYNKDNPIIKQFLDDKELGKMKIEHEGSFLGKAPKSYIFTHDNKTDIKLKGIPLNRSQKIDDDTYSYTQIRYIKNRYNKPISVQKVVKKVTNKNDKFKYLNGINSIWKSIKEYDEYYG